MKKVIIGLLSLMFFQIVVSQNKGTGLIPLTPEEMLKIQEVHSEFIGSNGIEQPAN